MAEGNWWEHKNSKTAAISPGNWGSKASATLKGMQGKHHDSGKRADDIAATMKANEEKQYGENQADIDKLNAGDTDYLGKQEGTTAKYQTDLDNLKNDIDKSRTESDRTYTNEIQPALKNLMERGRTEAGSAMTLTQSMDPNNAVHQANEAKYNQQATNEGREGLASAGTLQALGMRNMAGQMGDTPMTGGQMQAMMGANSAQSGAAFAGTQRRMQNLRDQGIAQGYNQSDLAYNRGRTAVQDYQGNIRDNESAATRNQDAQRQFRGESGANSAQGFGIQSQLNDTRRNVGNTGIQRNMANRNTHEGGQQANLGADIGRMNAEQTANANQTTGATTAIGTAAGTYFGQPAAGAAAGKAAGEASAPTATQVPQYAKYGAEQNIAQNPNDQGGGDQGSDFGPGQAPTPVTGTNAQGGGKQGMSLTEQMNQRRNRRA